MGEQDSIKQAPGLGELPDSSEQTSPQQAESKTSPLQEQLQQRKQ